MKLEVEIIWFNPSGKAGPPAAGCPGTREKEEKKK